jgi:hypothetical protein
MVSKCSDQAKEELDQAVELDLDWEDLEDSEILLHKRLGCSGSREMAAEFHHSRWGVVPGRPLGILQSAVKGGRKDIQV